MTAQNENEESAFRIQLGGALYGRAPQEFRGITQFFFDAQQLVVLGNAIAAAGGTGLDLAGAEAHHEISDESVLGFTRAMRDH